MEQTTNLGLNTWASTDGVNVEEINENFRILDENVCHLVKLAEGTAPDVSEGYLEVELPGLDWDKFAEYTLDIYYNTTGYTNYLYINDLNTQGDYLDGEGEADNNMAYFINGSDELNVWMRFVICKLLDGVMIRLLSVKMNKAYVRDEKIIIMPDGSPFQETFVIKFSNVPAWDTTYRLVGLTR